MMTKEIQLSTVDRVETDLVAAYASGGMQSQVGRGAVVVVVERVDPAESITRLGLINVRERDNQLRD